MQKILNKINKSIKNDGFRYNKNERSPDRHRIGQFGPFNRSKLKYLQKNYLDSSIEASSRSNGSARSLKTSERGDFNSFV